MRNSKLVFIAILAASLFVIITINQLWIQHNDSSLQKTKVSSFHPDSIVSSTSNGLLLIQIRAISTVNPVAANNALRQFELENHSPLTPLEEAYRLLISLSIERTRNNQQHVEQYIKQLHQIADKEQYTWLKAAIYVEQAHIYALQDKKKEGQETINKAIELAKESNALYLLPSAYRIAGFISNTLNELIVAQDYFLQGINIAEQLSMNEDNAKLHNNLAVLYMIIQDWNKALEAIQIAAELYSKNPTVNKQMMYVLYSNESKIYHNLNNIKLSKQALDKADLYYNEKTALPRSKILHWKSHSELLLLEGKYSEAIDNLEHCFSYPFINKYPSEEGQCSLLLSKILFKQHQYNQALGRVNDSIKIFTAIDHDRGLTRAYAQKADILTSLKRDREALDIYKQYSQRERLQLSKQMYELIRSVETRKLSQERDLLNMEKTLAETELAKQRLLLHIMSFCSALIVVVLLFAIRQVIRVRHTNKKLEELSHIDTLTGLYNRRYYYQQLTECCTIDAEHSYRIVLFDIDDFKWINDEHGHDVGDEVLIEISRRINALLAPQELLTRWGGEEFLALIKDDRNLMTRVEQLRLAIHQTPFMTNAGELCVSCSIGVSTAALPCDIDGNDDYFRKADKNLYEAKRSGKNQVVFPLI